MHRAFQVREARLGQVTAHRADHAAGQLVPQVGGVEGLRAAGRQAFGLGQLREVAATSASASSSMSTLMPERAQVGDDAFGGRIRGAVGRGAGGALQGADAEVRRIHVGQLGQPDGAMACSSSGLSPMHRLDRRDQRRARAAASSRPPGSLMYSASTSGQAASVRARLDVVRIVVDRAQRVHQRRDDVFAARLP